MALIIGLLRALLQLRDRGFRRLLLRSLVYAAMLVTGFGVLAGWLVSLLPDTMALPLFGKLTLPLIGEVTVPSAGQVSIPLRQVETMSIPLVIMVSSLLMLPTVAVVVNLMLDEIVDTVEARYYPRLPALARSGRAEIAVGAMAFSAIVLAVNLVALIFYLVAGALAPLVFWLVNGLVIGREVFTLVAGRRLSPDEVGALRREHAGAIWIAGFLMAVLVSLPLIAFVVPVLGVAAHAHMFHRFRGTESGTARPADADSGDAPAGAVVARLRRLRERRLIEPVMSRLSGSRGRALARVERLLALPRRVGGVRREILRAISKGFEETAPDVRRPGREQSPVSGPGPLARAIAPAIAPAEPADPLPRPCGGGEVGTTEVRALGELLDRLEEEVRRLQVARSAKDAPKPVGGLETVTAGSLGDYRTVN